jgi:hypothetical protein
VNIPVVLLLSVLASQDPVAHWTFDRDLQDSGAQSLPTKAEGRLEFIDSPIGKSGRAAVFNGVDAWIDVRPAKALGAGAEDFSVSAWILPLDRRSATIVGRSTWSLLMLDSGVLQFRSPAGTLTTGPGAAPVGEWSHVAVSVERGGVSRITVNGAVLGKGEIHAGNLDPETSPLAIGKGVDDPKLFAGLLDEVAVYSHALNAGEIQKVLEDGPPWLRPKAHARTPFPGKFELLENDVVVFTGGEDARVSQEQGYLETLLSLSAPGRRVHFRSMAWEGDTVYEQPRPLNFGSWTDQFRRCGASIIVAQFGQLEALQGKDGLDRFVTAYESLLSQFARTTERIILVSPAPFGKGQARGPELTARNADLKLYVDAIRGIAARHKFLFVDLSGPALGAEGISRDGLHLSGAGQWAAARETARQLEIPGLSDLDAPDARGEFRKDSVEKLRSAIRVKNGLWTDYWRPSNWAFLNGDRIEQPSSRDHVDRRIRWFPVEMQQYPALVRREEDRIDSLLEKK